MKNIIFIIGLVFTLSNLNAQDFAVDKNSILFSGTLSFKSSGGELYSGDGNDRLNSITIAPSLSYFILKNIFVSGSAGYSRISQGNDHISSFGFGPNLGYAYGNSESIFFPYITAGYRYNTMDGVEYLKSSNYNAFLCGLGIMGMSKGRAGIILEINYQMSDAKIYFSGASGHSDLLSLSIGVVGLLY